MDSLKLKEITGAIRGKSINCSDEVIVEGIAADFGKVKKGYLFIPPEENMEDWDAVAEAACKNGAAAVVTSKKLDIDIPQIIVKSNKWAYRRLYRYYRNKFSIPVIGITGSAGKTSTKDMLNLILGRQFDVCKTTASDNSLRDTIQTIFSMKSTTGAAIFEFGFAGYYNYIYAMASAARPNIGIITNISTAHRHVLGTKENIMKAKMEITTFFDKDSVLIINSDDDYLSKISDKPYKIIKVSTNGLGDYNAYDIVNKGERGVEFKCLIDGNEHLFQLNVPGVHFVYSALFGIAVGQLLHMDIEQIKKAIAEFKPPGRRMHIIRLKNNIRIINDCYNANLLSMESGLDVLQSFKAGRKIAVLGDIFKQGVYSEETHRELGKYVRDKCDILITVGEASEYIYEEAKNFIDARHFISKEEACKYLESLLKRDDLILIKGSRGMRMEDITKCLAASFIGR